jgi:hypothetical protein
MSATSDIDRVWGIAEKIKMPPWQNHRGSHPMLRRGALGGEAEAQNIGRITPHRMGPPRSLARLPMRLRRGGRAALGSCLSNGRAAPPSPLVKLAATSENAAEAFRFHCPHELFECLVVCFELTVPDDRVVVVVDNSRDHLVCSSRQMQTSTEIPPRLNRPL